MRKKNNLVKKLQKILKGGKIKRFEIEDLEPFDTLDDIHQQGGQNLQAYFGIQIQKNQLNENTKEYHKQIETILKIYNSIKDEST